MKVMQGICLVLTSHVAWLHILVYIISHQPVRAELARTREPLRPEECVEIYIYGLIIAIAVTDLSQMMC